MGSSGCTVPCSGLTCQKKTGSAFPIAFGLTVDGVTAADTQSTPPRFKVLRPRSPVARVEPHSRRMALGTTSCRTHTTQRQAPAVGSTSRLRVLDQLSPGNTTSRGEDFATGLNLPTGCYSFVVEDEGTNKSYRFTVGSNSQAQHHADQVSTYQATSYCQDRPRTATRPSPSRINYGKAQRGTGARRLRASAARGSGGSASARRARNF